MMGSDSSSPPGTPPRSSSRRCSPKSPRKSSISPRRSPHFRASRSPERKRGRLRKLSGGAGSSRSREGRDSHHSPPSNRIVNSYNICRSSRRSPKSPRRSSKSPRCSPKSPRRSSKSPRRSPDFRARRSPERKRGSFRKLSGGAGSSRSREGRDSRHSPPRASSPPRSEPKCSSPKRKKENQRSPEIACPRSPKREKECSTENTKRAGPRSPERGRPHTPEKSLHPHTPNRDITKRERSLSPSSRKRSRTRSRSPIVIPVRESDTHGSSQGSSRGNISPRYKETDTSRISGEITERYRDSVPRGKEGSLSELSSFQTSEGIVLSASDLKKITIDIRRNIPAENTAPTRHAVENIIIDPKAFLVVHRPGQGIFGEGVRGIFDRPEIRNRARELELEQQLEEIRKNQSEHRRCNCRSSSPSRSTVVEQDRRIVAIIDDAQPVPSTSTARNRSPVRYVESRPVREGHRDVERSREYTHHSSPLPERKYETREGSVERSETRHRDLRCRERSRSRERYRDYRDVEKSESKTKVERRNNHEDRDSRYHRIVQESDRSERREQRRPSPPGERRRHSDSRRSPVKEKSSKVRVEESRRSRSSPRRESSAERYRRRWSPTPPSTATTSSSSHQPVSSEIADYTYADPRSYYTEYVPNMPNYKQQYIEPVRAVLPPRPISGFIRGRPDMRHPFRPVPPIRALIPIPHLPMPIPPPHRVMFPQRGFVPRYRGGTSGVASQQPPESSFKTSEEDNKEK